MAVTQLQIDTYLSNVCSSFVEFGDKLGDYQQIGRKELFCLKRRFILASWMLRIIEDYFVPGESEYEDYNFFDTVEAKNIIQHLNKLLGVDYNLDL